MADIFISYSRKDIAFARLIREALQQGRLDTWIDWERIPVGRRWREEIYEAIEAAGIFLFIVSDHSLGSEVCKDEIGRALQNHKRIIPVLVDRVTPAAVQAFVPDLAPINWIVMERDRIFRLVESLEVLSDNPEDRQVALPAAPQFEEALHRLNQAIHTDWEWVKFHTRLQVDALRWERNGKQPDYLMRGAGLREAEGWLGEAGGKDPAPTPLQTEFVQSSRTAEEQQRQQRLGRADRWWEREENVSPYAPDFELICIHCSYSYTFTPSEHLPMPDSCPSCGFAGKGSFRS